MGRVGLVGLLFLLLPDSRDLPDLLGPSLRASAQDPVFRSQASELVVLPVVVTDRQSRFISDLPKEQFGVYDNGRRMAIDFFTNEDTPATIGLIVDASGSMRSKLGEVIDATLAFAKSSNPLDELFALRFNDDVQDAIGGRRFLLAEDRDALRAAIAGMRIEGRTALYDALLDGLARLHDGSRTRKALVVISDGGDNASQAKLDDVLAKARASNAAIYTIGIYDATDMDKNPGALKALAQTTGGERFLPGSPGELMQAVERIAREIRSGYTIGYAPPDRDGNFHRVRVGIEPPDARRLTVRTRPGYFAAGPGK